MTYISDLEIILVSPTGTQTSLIDYRTLCNNEDDWNHGLEDGGLNKMYSMSYTDGLITPTIFQVLALVMEIGLVVYDYFTGDAATTPNGIWVCTLIYDGVLTTKQSFSGCDSYVYVGISPHRPQQ